MGIYGYRDYFYCCPVSPGCAGLPLLLGYLVHFAVHFLGHKFAGKQMVQTGFFLKKRKSVSRCFGKG
ncbi:hypothetical protein KCP71_17595 [Salmonella enterica subsp. enterica]|nr:hypothetical protein KCP71_17595 [Salmonella enterica subsp. enterica]